MKTVAAYPYQPVKERGTLRSFLFALFMHLLLGIVLYYGVHWQGSTPVGALPATMAWVTAGLFQSTKSLMREGSAVESARQRSPLVGS